MLNERTATSADVSQEASVVSGRAADIAGSRPLRIPHPLECARRRPARAPSWEPARDRRDAGGQRLRPSTAEGWHSPKLVTAVDAGAVDINFTYRNWHTTSATFGMKPGRNQYVEGPHEEAFLRFLETNAAVIDYQFQAATIEWTTAKGERREYTVDGGYETSAGLTFFENKASQAYFDDPEIADRIGQAESFLATLGIAFDRVVGSHLIDPMRWRVVKDVFDNRKTPFGPRQLATLDETCAADGGATTLGRLLSLLSPHRQRARAIADAMLVRRVVDFDLRLPPTDHTLVRRVEEVEPRGLLRALLSLHANG